MKKTSSSKKIDTIRMKDIIVQLTDIIYLLCGAKETDIFTILNQFTNLTPSEYESLHLIFSQDHLSKK